MRWKVASCIARALTWSCMSVGVQMTWQCKYGRRKERTVKVKNGFNCLSREWGIFSIIRAFFHRDSLQLSSAQLSNRSSAQVPRFFRRRRLTHFHSPSSLPAILKLHPRSCGHDHRLRLPLESAFASIVLRLLQLLYQAFAQY